MADAMEPPVNETPIEGGIVLDREFLKEQASEALATFVAPLAGVVAAARGDRWIVFRRRHRSKRAA